jgi:hypothetical protein
VIYLAQRLDTGERVEFEDDPERVVGHGERLRLCLDGEPVECIRVFTTPQVVASDRRKCYDEHYQSVRSDGRFSSIQMPTLEQIEATDAAIARGESGTRIPRAKRYTPGGDAAFMNRSEGRDYAKALTDAGQPTQYDG